MAFLLTDSCKLCRFLATYSLPFRDGLEGGSDPAGESGRPEIQPVAIAEDDWWIIALNENQATLGRVYFVLKRHDEDVAALTDDEQEALWRHLKAVKTALTRLFAPDHFNAMFLMNLVRHAHFHIYPRYASPRSFVGLSFTDPQYGGHYDPAADRRLDDRTRDALATALREALE